jgi:hypothetical protein
MNKEEIRKLVAFIENGESLDPNEETIEAMKAARRGELIPVASPAELFSDIATREDLQKILDSRAERENISIQESVDRTVDRVTKAIREGKLFINRVPVNERVVKEVSKIFAAQGIKLDFVESARNKKTGRMGGNSRGNCSLRFSLLKGK